MSKYHHTAILSDRAVIVTSVHPPLTEHGAAILDAFLYPQMQGGYGVQWLRPQSFIVDHAGFDSESMRSYSQHIGYLCRSGLIEYDHETFGDELGVRLTEAGHAVVCAIGGVA